MIFDLLQSDFNKLLRDFRLVPERFCELAERFLLVQGRFCKLYLFKEDFVKAAERFSFDQKFRLFSDSKSWIFNFSTNSKSWILSYSKKSFLFFLFVIFYSAKKKKHV